MRTQSMDDVDSLLRVYHSGIQSGELAVGQKEALDRLVHFAVIEIGDLAEHVVERTRFLADSHHADHHRRKHLAGREAGTHLVARSDHILGVFYGLMNLVVLLPIGRDFSKSEPLVFIYKVPMTN